MDRTTEEHDESSYHKSKGRAALLPKEEKYNVSTTAKVVTAIITICACALIYRKFSQTE